MSLDSSLTAFLAGLGTGAHCALMCGPLACAFRVRPLEYHAGRVVSYGVTGAVCGGVGSLVLGGFNHTAARVAPWVLLAVVLSMALGIESRLPMPAFARRLGGRLRLDSNLGWLTPLLPCGPLWLMLGAAVAAGSALAGGVLLVWFALGTVCLYAALQAGFLRVQRAGSPKFVVRLQRAMLWTAVLALGWRLWNGGTHECCAL